MLAQLPGSASELPRATRFPEDLDLSGTRLLSLALPCSSCLGIRELGCGWLGDTLTSQLTIPQAQAQTYF